MENKMIKPFTVGIMKDKEEQPTTQVTKKLYLLLKVYNSGSDNAEDYRDFEFIEGTRQEVYDQIKIEIQTNRDFDIMRSRILVDAPTISISHKCSIYLFMKEAKDFGKIVDETSFDIDSYYYDINDSEDGYNGEEE